MKKITKAIIRDFIFTFGIIICGWQMFNSFHTVKEKILLSIILVALLFLDYTSAKRFWENK